MLKKLTQSIIVLVLAANVSFAGGFQINEHGAKAMAMAGAFTGLANDPSAIFFNGAGLTQLEGTQLLAGVTLISPAASFRGPSPAITEYSVQDKIFHPINFYLTHQFDENWFVGLGINNPYGLGTKWDDDWVGRYLALDTEIRTFYFSPTVAYKVNENLSLSVGFVFAYGDVKIIRYANLFPFDGEIKVNLEGDGTSVGFNAGVLFKPSDFLQLGLSFRSNNTFNFEGEATSTGPAALSASYPKGDIAAELTTPMNVTLGAALFPMKELTITADFQYVGWSSYDKLAVDFKDPATSDLSAVRDYENTFIARLGGEYKLSSSFALRGGLFYDNNPVKDQYVEPTLPDSDRLGFNIGLGYKLTDDLAIDLAYLFLRFSEREITDSKENYSGISGANAPFNGVYNSSAHLFGINFSYSL